MLDTLLAIPKKRHLLVKKFLQAFIEDRCTKYWKLQYGLCCNVDQTNVPFYKYLKVLVGREQILCDEYPIFDPQGEGDAQWQYDTLPHYEGRQLTLRISLAKMVISLIDEVLEEMEKENVRCKHAVSTKRLSIFW